MLLAVKRLEVQDDPTTYETILGFKPFKTKTYAVHFVIIDLLSNDPTTADCSFPRVDFKLLLENDNAICDHHLLIKCY